MARYDRNYSELQVPELAAPKPVLPAAVGDPASCLTQLLASFVLLQVVTQFLALESALDDSVGQTLQFLVERGGAIVPVSVTVQDLHSITPSRFLEVSGGIVHSLSYQQARNFRFPCGQVYVAERGYMLSRAGVPRYAIIRKLAGQETETLEDFMRVLQGLQKGSKVPIEYVTYTDRHRPTSVLLLVDGHQWYPQPQIYTREDTTGLWRATPAFEAPQAVGMPSPEAQRNGKRARVDGPLSSLGPLGADVAAAKCQVGRVDASGGSARDTPVEGSQLADAAGHIDAPGLGVPPHPAPNAGESQTHAHPLSLAKVQAQGEGQGEGAEVAHDKAVLPGQGAEGVGEEAPERLGPAAAAAAAAVATAPANLPATANPPLVEQALEASFVMMEVSGGGIQNSQFCTLHSAGLHSEAVSCPLKAMQPLYSCTVLCCIVLHCLVLFCMVLLCCALLRCTVRCCCAWPRVLGQHLPSCPCTPLLRCTCPRAR